MKETTLSVFMDINRDETCENNNSNNINMSISGI